MYPALRAGHNSIRNAMHQKPMSTLAIALYEPDIPQNAGTILRLGACLGVPVHFVGPAAFPTTERAFRRAGLDYLDHAELVNHVSFAAFEAWRRGAGRRLALLTVRGETPYTEFDFRPDDVLLCGRESAGAPQEVHAAADVRLRVPIRAPLRSLNVAVSLAMVLGEALRQTGGFHDG
jgi:tRNA (cytidine/uridine-2'-O-)-methyltransferase